MTVDNTGRRYMARVDFLACKETIDSMLAQGFSKKLIHERLIADGRCSMNYITFCEFIRNADKPALLPAHTPPAPSPAHMANPTIPPKLPSVPVAPKKLSRPEDVDRDSLF